MRFSTSPIGNICFKCLSKSAFPRTILIFSERKSAPYVCKDFLLIWNSYQKFGEFRTQNLIRKKIKSGPKHVTHHNQHTLNYLYVDIVVNKWKQNKCKTPNLLNEYWLKKKAKTGNCQYAFTGRVRWLLVFVLYSFVVVAIHNVVRLFCWYEYRYFIARCLKSNRSICCSCETDTNAMRIFCFLFFVFHENFVVLFWNDCWKNTNI